MSTVRDAMNPVGVTVGSGHSIREAARRMMHGRVGAAVVLDPELLPAPGIVTERDVLRCVGAGCDPETELVSDHLTADVVYAQPDWPLELAAEQMVRGGFRHVIVIDGSEIVGILSMRDIVRRWVGDAASVATAAAASAA